MHLHSPEHPKTSAGFTPASARTSAPGPPDGRQPGVKNPLYGFANPKKPGTRISTSPPPSSTGNAGIARARSRPPVAGEPAPGQAADAFTSFLRENEGFLAKERSEAVGTEGFRRGISRRISFPVSRRRGRRLWGTPKKPAGEPRVTPRGPRCPTGSSQAALHGQPPVSPSPPSQPGAVGRGECQRRAGRILPRGDAETGRSPPFPALFPGTGVAARQLCRKPRGGDLRRRFASAPAFPSF